MQALWVVGVFLPVQGAKRVVLVGETKDIQTDVFFGALAVVQHGIKHHIANVNDALRRLGAIRTNDWERKAFLLQVLYRRLRRAQQQVGDAIGKHTVNLFRHGGVVRAKAGFNMRYRSVKLGRRHRAGERGVGVTVHQYPIGLFLLDERLNAFKHASSHGTVAQSCNVQVVVRARDVELLEEYIRHVGIKMLAGVNDDFFDVFAGLDRATDGRSLNKLWAGAENGEEFHASKALTILS